MCQINLYPRGRKKDSCQKNDKDNDELVMLSIISNSGQKKKEGHKAARPHYHPRVHQFMLIHFGGRGEGMVGDLWPYLVFTVVQGSFCPLALRLVAGRNALGNQLRRMWGSWITTINPSTENSERVQEEQVYLQVWPDKESRRANEILVDHENTSGRQELKLAPSSPPPPSPVVFIHSGRWWLSVVACLLESENRPLRLCASKNESVFVILQRTWAKRDKSLFGPRFKFVKQPTHRPNRGHLQRLLPPVLESDCAYWRSAWKKEIQ